MNMYQTSANLQRLMRDSGDNQVTLSQKTGVHQSTIQRILKGLIKDPKLKQLVPLCDYFNISIDQLIGRNQDLENENAKAVQHLNALCAEDRAIYMLALEAKAATINPVSTDSKRNVKKHSPISG